MPCHKILRVIGLALFIFFIVGSMAAVLGTTLAIIIGIGMLFYLFSPDEND